MRIAVDTNVLARALLQDDVEQTTKAVALLKQASHIAIPLPSLCELVWILIRGAKMPRADVARAIRALMHTQNVEMNRQGVEAGLVMLEAGGDFADGVIAFEGRWLGGDVFVSFDKQAVTLLNDQGFSAQLLT